MNGSPLTIGDLGEVRLYGFHSPSLMDTNRSPNYFVIGIQHVMANITCKITVPVQVHYDYFQYVCYDNEVVTLCRYGPKQQNLTSL